LSIIFSFNANLIICKFVLKLNYMESIKGKIVIITGTTSGFGLAISRLFAEHGANLIIAARREERLKELESELKKKYNTEVHSLKLDVRDNDAVKKAIETLPDNWKKIDILINNAGLSRGLDKLYEGSIQDWEEMIDTNVKGLLYMSRAVLPGMVERKSGHVVNIGSIAGHEVYPKGNVYCASKHAVDAITKGMRIDLNGTDVKVTTIDPGLAETEFSIVRFRGDSEKAKAVYTGIEALTPEDIADAALYAVTRRKNFVIAEMILLPINQASAAVVHREG
jgi:3-hydroxy acid dehydrogenase / malonic semialdehyde reductase